MNKKRMIAFISLMTVLSILMVIKLSNEDEKDQLWYGAQKTQGQEKLTYKHLSYRDYMYCGRFYWCDSGTNIFLNALSESGKKVSFLIKKEYPFLDKSEITVTYFTILNKRCPLKIEANFENKTYLLDEIVNIPPNSLENYVQRICY